MDDQAKWIRIRIRFIGFCFIAVFSLIVFRAFDLQVRNQEEWSKRAERQHQKTIPLTPQRGTIYDRNGEVLSLSIEVDSIFAEPRNITDGSQAAKQISAALSLPYSVVRSKITSDKSFVWLKRQVTPSESEEVRKLGLQGIGFIQEHRRFYPNSEIGAHVIGFTGLDPRGLEGLELEYDAQLLGQGGYLVTERDALGRSLGSGRYTVRGQRGGSSMYLTLDKNLQYIAEKELKLGMRESRSRAGTAIVLDPDSGRILAMANQPNFNPNAFFNFRPAQWRNRAVCDTFEPGSTFKIFLMAAALEEGLVRPDQKIYCEKGVYRVGGQTIHDHRAYGDLKISEVIKFSSNIGVAKIGKLLEREKYFRYISEFGFGGKTDIHLPGEVPGLVRNPAQWFEIDLAAISFGQGISVTALQLAAATAAIANGGYLMAPYIVQSIVDPYGQETERREPKIVRQVISEKSARQVREMMAMVTEEGGTGTLARVPGYRVGGKTGTAQKIDPVTGGYSADKRVASFVGFAPVDDPKLVILVALDEPEEKIYGGLVAAPVFSRIAAQALPYMNVLPDRTERAAPPEAPVPSIQVRDSRPPVAPAAAEKKGAGPRMPDFTGMSYRQVLQVMERTGLNLKLRGNGRVVEQHPASGREVTYGTEIWVRLASPS